MPVNTKKFITRVYADDTLMAESEGFSIWHTTLTQIHREQAQMAKEAARAEAQAEWDRQREENERRPSSLAKKKVDEDEDEDEDEDDDDLDGD